MAIAGSETVLVDDGQSLQPSFSPKGDKMLFVSGKRASHNAQQVYERDMATGKERRITFQSGSTWHPRYNSTGEWILYSSSTDELKEHSPLLVPVAEVKPSKLPPPYNEPVDVYLHALNGLQIRRITARPGFDGEARFSSDGKQIVWTRISKDRAAVVIQEASSEGSPRPLHGLGTNPTSFASALGGRLNAWVDWDMSFGVSRLRLRNGKEVTDVAADMIVTKIDPEFSPDGKWLLWSQKDPESELYGLWGYNIANKCLHRFLFSSTGDRRHPVVTPDMKMLTYTWVNRGRSRIAQVPFVQRTGPCPVPP
ncbi:MAG: PD40 domain-containing protein [Bdellovibrionales bacterium]|nr:PD40 domain-containing protein [Bdellovibrionales bacterium]